MSLIKGVEIWWVKCNPNRPNGQYNKDNPTWEVMVKTTNKERVEELKAHGVKMTPNEENGKIVYSGRVKKKSKKRDPKDNTKFIDAKPVQVVRGDLTELDPDTIGNGSIANIRVISRDYEAGGVKKKTATLMAIQVTTHNVYVPKPRDDDFEVSDTKVNAPVEGGEEPQDDSPDDESGGEF